ncbi:MAG: TerB family tellurite resistance protein [Cytophagales bacterium]|nr:TerB family tellurite resistance protein [Cytophaga sp.]
MAKENIHRAMGSLAYAIAVADSIIQPSEKEIILKLATKEFQLSDSDSEWINNMFKELESKGINLSDAYDYALDTLEANRHDYDFDDAMKQKCLSFMKKIGDAFGETDLQEQSVIERFTEDIARF